MSADVTSGEQFSRPWKVLAVVFEFAVLFAVVAVAAVVIGVHDASLDQAGFGVTVGGVVLIGIGVLLLIAAGDLVRVGRMRVWEGGICPPCRLVVIAALFVTMLLGIYVFFAGLGTASAQWPFVVGVGLVFVAAALLGLRFFTDTSHVTLPRIGAAVAVGVIGTAVGA